MTVENGGWGTWARELDHLGKLATRGLLSRRDFLGRAAALGVSSVFANSLQASAARAAGPVKGGILKAGLQGGEFDQQSRPRAEPQPGHLQLLQAVGRVPCPPDSPRAGCENLIAEEIGASADAKTWTMKVRDGVEFHNGKSVTAEDVVATIERGLRREIAVGRAGRAEVDHRRSRPNGKEPRGDTLHDADADFPYLMADYHLVIEPNGGKDNPMPASARGPTR